MTTNPILKQAKNPATHLTWAKVWPELAILAFYVGLALIFTWPLALHWREAIPGDGRDGWQNVWNLWWIRYALEQGQNPFQTNLLFYPQGTGLYLHSLAALNGLISLPVQYLGGPVAAYNFVVLVCLSFSAYGAFCLARYLWGSVWGALLAGVAFGFSTYHFTHLLGHLNLLSTELIPFYILFLLQALNRRQNWRRPALLAVLTLVGGTLLELQYILYLAIFSLVYLVYIPLLSGIERWQTGRRKATGYSFSNGPSAIVAVKASVRPKLAVALGRAVLIAGLYLLVTLPLTLPLLNEALTNPNSVPPREDLIYSADLLAYFYPSPFHPIWGGAIREAIKPWTATLIEKVVFPGYTVYLLALLGLVLWLWQARKSRKGLLNQTEVRVGNAAGVVDSSASDEATIAHEWRPGAFFWLVVALSFILISFGRKLHINGVEFGPTLPAALIYKLPILNITRVPSRYAVMAILALAMLAAWGFAKFQVTSNKYQVAGLKNRSALIVNGVGIVALGALLFELWPAPYQLDYYSVPEFYKKLGADTGQYAILDVPLNVGRDYQYLTDYMKAQIEHHKPLIGGYISRNPVYPLYYGVPVFWEFSQFQNGPRPDILPAPQDEKAILRYFGVRYIIIHKDLVRGKRQEAALGEAFRLFPQGPVYDVENLVVFEVPPATQNEPLFFANLVQSSFYEAEKGGDGKYSRWAQGATAGLDFWSDRLRTVEINFPIWSFHEKHLVDLVFNGTSLSKQEIGDQPQTLTLKLDLKPGRNRLDLKISGKANRPADLGPGNDTRSLTIGVGEIKITPSN